MMRAFYTLFLLLCAALSFAQSTTFQAQHVKKGSFPELEEQFYQYAVYELDVQPFNAFVKNSGPAMEFTLQAGSHEWDIWLMPKDIRSSDYSLRVHAPDGIKIFPKGDNITYRGLLQSSGGGVVALTIDTNFVYGFITEGEELFFIEPVWYFIPGTAKNRFVIYKSSDVKPKPGAVCGAIDLNKHSKNIQEEQEIKPGDDSLEKIGNCYTVQLAIASDKSMFTKYISVPLVEAHNLGVMNNVQTNYDNEFSDEISFEIVEQFVVTGTDPWTSSTDPGVLLSDFRSWGNSGGFSTTYDLAQLWTNRNFDGSTIGIAYIDGLCNSFRYHCLQDFTNTASLLRCMTSHEIGHNFDADHDSPSSPHIMAPAVQNTNTWSTQSQNQINANILQNDPPGGCLSTCPGSLPPTANFSATPTTGCTPMVVSFTDLSTNSPIAWSWTFPGGTPATSTQQNPVVTYSVPGVYSVTLTATNLAGSNTLTQNNLITVNSLPTPIFTWSQVGLTLIFSNSSSSNSTNYLWDFGDGSTSTETNPIHNYATDGFYTVTLTAINTCGSVPLTITIPVFTPPTANFTASPTSGCASLQVNFTNQSTVNATSWSWSFPGGVPANSTSSNPPPVTYNAPGTYSVTLIVTNPAGSDTEIKTNYITVTTIPTPGFNSSVNGSTVNFTNTSNNATSYSWNFGDGSPASTETNPTHTYSNGGTYTVTLTATNSCGPATISHTVTIDVPPIAAFSSNTTTGCSPMSVTFENNSSGNATSYEWSFPGGSPSSSTEEEPTVIYTTPGTFDVTLIASNGVGSDTMTFEDYITVNPAAIAGFTSSINGTTVNFTNTSSNATSYSWNFGDGSTSTATNPSHTYAGDGTYTVTLSATNDCGTVTTSQTVTIVTPPTAGFTSNITSGCEPLTVQFTNQSSPNSTSFNWSFPGGNPNSSTAQNPTVTYNAPGNYTVTLTVSNAAGDNTLTQTNYITVNTTPTAGFTFDVNGTTADFTNSSSNGTGYSWNFGDGSPASTETNPTHNYSGDGTYTVTLSATNACGTVTTTQTVIIVTPPSAGFSANVSSGCLPLTVQFSNESTANATSFEWSFPGANPGSSTEENPTVTYNAAGDYTVILIVSNAAGTDTLMETSYIGVNSVPVAGFNAGTNVFVVTFTNTTLNGASYSWDFGDSSSASNEVNPVHTYPGDGTYSVTLTATNACGTDTYTQEIVVTSLPQANFSAGNTSGCSPFTVQFNDESSSNTTSWDWSFPGGSPSSSTGQNPSVTYSTPGTYNVSLTVSNALGNNTITQTGYITVGTTPTASFSKTVNGTSVTFNNSSSNATSYEWDFGDGGTSTDEDPVHEYAGDGTYTVTLTATNDCGSVTTTQTVTIVTPPTAGFSATITGGCAPLSVQFNNESSANSTNFSWSFPGGTPSSSTEQNPVVTYNSGGTYTVTLTVSNAAGNNSTTQTDYIEVGSMPTAGFVAGINGTIASFTNNTVNGVSYEWDFGDGQTSLDENPSHEYGGDGIYMVTLTATNDCGSVTFEQAVTVVTPPTAGFSAQVTGGCAPLTVQFSNESSANATDFQWSFPGGSPSTSTDANPIVTYNSAGTYSVTLTVSNVAGTDTYDLMDYITVKPAPAAGFTYAILGGTVSFANSSVNATSYEWDFGDESTSTEENPSHTYAGDGLYTVTLTATNDCGSVTFTQTVVVAFEGPVAFFQAENTSGCPPLTVTFENLSSENSTSFSWSFPGGIPATSSEENPTITYDTPGLYDVTLIAGNGVSSDTFTQTAFIEVNKPPVAGFDVDVTLGTVTFTNNSTSTTSFEWDFGDGNTSTEENPVHTYQASGEYTVTLTATNECGFMVATQTVIIQLTGVEDIPGIEEFNVFPNPNSGRFTVTIKGQPLASLELSFTNVLGQRLMNETADFRSGELTKEVQYDGLPSGMYIFQVKSGEKALYRKVVVE